MDRVYVLKKFEIGPCLLLLAFLMCVHKLGTELKSKICSRARSSYLLVIIHLAVKQ